ncbi:UNVERIFIED_CONTAM: Adenylate isopentenyltransferase 5, chloroplastic [Sesamum indicum]
MMNFSVWGMMNKHQGKDKVVVVLGATGTGKSHLAIDLATRFGAEVINLDKIQVYKGLDIVTNKVRNEECRSVLHHLLGIIDPEVDLTVHDFVHHALLAADAIVQKNWLPIIAEGSNSFIQTLVSDDLSFPPSTSVFFSGWMWRSRSSIRTCRKGLIRWWIAGCWRRVSHFLTQKFSHYHYGIRRAIGAPEMDEFFRSEGVVDGDIKILMKLR